MEIAITPTNLAYRMSAKINKVSQNIYVIKRLCKKRQITKCLYHTTKTVIKRQTSWKVNIIKHQMLQNIKLQNENVTKQQEMSNRT